MSKKKSSNGHTKNVTTREGVERRRYVTNLPVPADPKTIAKASANFARLVSEDESLQEERRDAMAGFKSRKNVIDEQLREWRDTVEKGTQLAAVEVVELLVVETSEIQVKRLDTGEIIETRAASAEDRQEQLDLDAQAATEKETPKGTAAARKKRGGKTTVVAGADAE